jgi:hypothetical protein
LAVRKGYRILEVYEVYEYVTIYDPESKECCLFAGYIDIFLKLKQRLASIPPGFEARPTKRNI